MTNSDLACLAALMASAKILVFEDQGRKVVLHESAFAPAVSGQAPDEKTFAALPTDEELKFWSVEGEPEAPPEPKS